MNNKIKIIIVMSMLLFSFIPYNVSAWEADSVHIYQRYHSYSDDAEITDIDVGDSAYFNMTATISQRINGWQFQYFNFTAGVINCSNITQGFFFSSVIASAVGTINNVTGLIGGTWVDYTGEVANGGVWTNNTVNRSVVHVGITGVGCGDANFEINSINDAEFLAGGAEVPYTYHIGNITVHPQRTQSFVVTEDSGDVDLDWIKGSCADNTIIRGRQGTYPTDINNGTFVCNSTGTHFDWAVPNAGETWYFKSWSWNETEGLYSTKNSTDSVTLAGAAAWQIIDSTYNGQIFNVSVWTIIDNTYNGQIFNLSTTSSNAIYNYINATNANWSVDINGSIFPVDVNITINGNASFANVTGTSWNVSCTYNIATINSIQTILYNFTNLTIGQTYTVWVNITGGNNSIYTFTHSPTIPFDVMYTYTQSGDVLTFHAFVIGDTTDVNSNLTWTITDNSGSTVGTRLYNLTGGDLAYHTTWYKVADSWAYTLGNSESYTITLDAYDGNTTESYSIIVAVSEPSTDDDDDDWISNIDDDASVDDYTEPPGFEFEILAMFAFIIFLIIPLFWWKEDKRKRKQRRRTSSQNRIELVLRGKR